MENCILCAIEIIIVVQSCAYIKKLSVGGSQKKYIVNVVMSVMHDNKRSRIYILKSDAYATQCRRKVRQTVSRNCFL